MGKIGDLWVRLGLKKSEFDKGLDDAGKKAKNFGGVLKGIAGIGTAVFAAVGAAVVKFAKDAVSMTQTWGDAWRVEMAGIKGAYSAFVRQISSGEGWSNLFANMREAARVARETAKALDEIFERNISLSYDEAQIDKQISEQQLIMRDASKTNAEREAAARRIIELTDQLGEKQKNVAADNAAAIRENFKAQTKMNDDEIDFLIRRYNENRNSIQQARAYDEERIKLQNSYNSALKQQGMGRYAQQLKDQLDDLEATTPAAIKSVAEMTRRYDKSNDELVAGLAQAETGVLRVEAAANRAKTRATATLGTLTAGPKTSDPNKAEVDRIQNAAAMSGKTEVQRIVEQYEKDYELLAKYRKDTTERTQQFQRDITEVLDFKVDPNNVLDSFATAPEILQRRYDELLALSEKYGLDTSALTEKFNRLMIQATAQLDAESNAQAQELDDWVAEWIAAFAQINGLDVDRVTEVVTADVKKMANEAGNAAENMADALDASMERMQRLVDEFTDSVVGGFSDGIQELTDQLMGISDVNAGAVFQALLTPLADMAVREGEILMAAGLGVEAVKKSLESLNGVAAIVAGAALITIGAAAKSGLAALASGGSNTTANYSGAGSGGAGTQTIRSELVVKVEGIVRGRDIVLSGQNTMNDYNR